MKLIAAALAILLLIGCSNTSSGDGGGLMTKDQEKSRTAKEVRPELNGAVIDPNSPDILFSHQPYWSGQDYSPTQYLTYLCYEGTRTTVNLNQVVFRIVSKVELLAGNRVHHVEFAAYLIRTAEYLTNLRLASHREALSRQKNRLECGNEKAIAAMFQGREFSVRYQYALQSNEPTPPEFVINTDDSSEGLAELDKHRDFIAKANKRIGIRSSTIAPLLPKAPPEEIKADVVEIGKYFVSYFKEASPGPSARLGHTLPFYGLTDAPTSHR